MLKIFLYPERKFSLYHFYISPFSLCVSGIAFMYHFELIWKDVTTLDKNIVYHKGFKHTNFREV